MRTSGQNSCIVTPCTLLKMAHAGEIAVVKVTIDYMY